jgi:CPA1 family monovalent cation:H+ antiporter
MPISEIVLISMALLTIAIVAAGLFRHFSIPYTVLLVGIGISLSELAHLFALLEPLKFFQLTPDLVFFIFLPALIFESGLSLNARQLVKDLAPVLALAVPALLISTTLVGLGIWLLLDIDLTMALLFGALISATDPVAVVALFKELGAPLRLNVLVEGESLFNDATAIVVFGILLSMILDGSSLNLVSGASAILEFLRVFLGGTVVGIISGLLVSELLFRLQSGKSAVLTMSIVTAYASFIIAEHSLHVSGVMATVSAAVTLSVYGLARISLDVKPLLTETWEFVSLVANSLLFLLVGLSINTGELFSHLDSIIIAVVVVSAARAAVVYSLIPTTVRVFNLPKITLAERHIMWWGGLKGGLAIAIVLSIPEALAGRDLLIILTLGVVLFSLMVNAWSIRPLMQYLKLDRLNNDEKAELELGLSHAQMAVDDMLKQYKDLGIISSKLVNQIGKTISNNLSSDKPGNTNRQSWRRVYLAAVRVEFVTLDHLYKSGLISQYTLLDIHNTLQIDREKNRHGPGQSQSPEGVNQLSIFQRIDMGALKLLREKNWAARLLSSFQFRRLRLHIERDIAGIIMSDAVINMLDKSIELDRDASDIIRQQYQVRLHRRLQRLKDLQHDFTDIYGEVEKQIFRHAALISAQVNTDDEFKHGEIGVKAYNHISQAIETVLIQEKALNNHLQDDIYERVRQVPLFTGLPENLIKIIADHVLQVTFLANDIIIGQGDKGDALYIIRHGEALVSKQDESSENIIIGELGETDFFGEMALLGDHVRTATVKARTSMTLLRLTRKDVLKIASQFEEVKNRLEQARDERLTSRPSADL